MTYSYSHLYRAMNGEYPDQWTDCEQKLHRERLLVEEFLDQGGKAYGFSSLFGHLDNISQERSALHSLVSGHLVGNPYRLGDKVASGILIMKLCQLSHSGTGITVDTYKKLHQALVDGAAVSADLYASYGSGDVVPAMWVAKSVIDDVENLPPGDLMCLINGAFVPAGVLLGIHDVLHDEVFLGVDLVSRTAQELQKNPKFHGVQLPVSLRDVSQLNKICISTCDDVRSQLERSANTASGNPLFNFSFGKAQPVSNSSFLNFPLSITLGNVVEMLRILSAYLTTSTRHLAAQVEDTAADENKPAVVQFPKVSKAYQDRVDGYAHPAMYSQVESLGVEDIGDASLLKVQVIMDILDVVSQQNQLLKDLLSMLSDN